MVCFISFTSKHQHINTHTHTELERRDDLPDTQGEREREHYRVVEFLFRSRGDVIIIECIIITNKKSTNKG